MVRELHKEELHIGQILKVSLVFTSICINRQQPICHCMPKDIPKSKSVMERRASKSIYNRMISLKFLLEVSIYDRQGMSVSTYKESLKVVRVSEKLSS